MFLYLFTPCSHEDKLNGGILVGRIYCFIVNHVMETTGNQKLAVCHENSQAGLVHTATNRAWTNKQDYGATTWMSPTSWVPLSLRKSDGPQGKEK